MRVKYIIALAVVFSAICVQATATDTKKVTPTLYKSVDNENMNRWVDSVYNQMTIDQRIGQLFMPVIPGNNTEDNKNRILGFVNNIHAGGFLFSKGNPLDQAELTNMAQNAAACPLMISLDGEWGLSMRLDNTTQFPRNMMLGAIQNDSLLYYYGKEVARQCKLMGIHVNFAPVLDVNSNPNNPVIGNRSYGEDTKRVAQLGIMYSEGLESGGIMAVAKHFPGHGDTSTDSHKTLPLIAHDKDRLDDVELKPFRKYINAGLSGIMVAHLNIPALDEKKQPSSLSTAITTDLLQDELGFSGLIFTDGLQMKGVADEKDYCVRALLAGNDILLGPVNPTKDYADVKKAVEDNILNEALIEAKCKKVLKYKYIFGLNDKPQISTVNLIEELNTPYADWLNRELNKEAITLLKNEDHSIPLKKLDKKKIAAISIGASADNAFHNTLKMYADVTCFSVADNGDLQQLKKDLRSYNTVIFSIHTNRSDISATIQSICQEKEAILTFFVVPYRMSSYSASIKQAKGVVLAYENTDLAQDYAAQAIFGGNKTEGKIPVSVKGLFKEGDGHHTKKIRLSYEVPESLGIPSVNLSAIDTIVQEGIKDEAYPGCQVLIAKDGVVIYNRSFGSFEYNGNRKVTNNDLYDLASMTKVSATLPAIMKLYDESEIKLNSTLSSFVPALRGTDKTGITIREALLHETGLAPYIPYYMTAIDENSYEGRLFSSNYSELYSAQFDRTTWARTDYKFKPNLISPSPKEGFIPLANNMYVSKAYKDTIVAAIANSTLRKRKSYLYSCLNFMLLKEVVENVSKEDLNTYVQDKFYKRLGAATTTYNPLTRFSKEKIAPTEKDDFLRKQLVQGYVHDEGAAFMGGISGNAGLFSSANDLAKLYQMWLNNGEYGDERYLSERTCKLFMSTKSATSRRGLGFDKPEMRTNKSSPTSQSAPASVYGHTGFTGTSFWVDPDNNLIYIFLSNRVYDKRTHYSLMGLNIRERIQEEIYKAIKKEKKEEITETNIETNTETNDE